MCVAWKKGRGARRVEILRGVVERRVEDTMGAGQGSRFGGLGVLTSSRIVLDSRGELLPTDASTGGGRNRREDSDKKHAH